VRWQIVYLARDLIFAPRTFVRPEVRSIAAPPDLGAPAPALPGAAPGRARIVAFLRHVGCPFAEATVRHMAALGTKYPAVDFVAVTHSREDVSRTWCDAFGGAGSVHLVGDPARAIYAAWGVGVSDSKHFAGNESLRAVVRLLDQGIHNRSPDGTRWQRAATFAVDATGILRWRHFPRHAGDLPPLDEAVAALVPRS
jgi:hypothetical protein